MKNRIKKIFATKAIAFSIACSFVHCLSMDVSQAEGTSTTSTTSTSNNIDDLIDENRTYNQVAWLTSHNAFANKDDHWIYYQQNISIEEQLEMGVRGLSLDVYPDYGGNYVVSEGKAFVEAQTLGKVKLDKGSRDIYLCHGSCNATKRFQRPLRTPRKLVDELKVISKFLKENPKAIITIFLESGVSTPDDIALLHKAFGDAGLKEMMTAGPELGKLYTDYNANWLTIRKMRETNQRLIVFSDDRSNNVLPTKDMISESIYNLAKDDRCQERTDYLTIKQVEKIVAERKDYPVINLNHFYELSVPNGNVLKYISSWINKVLGYKNKPAIHDYDEVNEKSRIIDRIVKHCWTAYKRLPNFLIVDFVEMGNNGGPLAVVKWMNEQPVESFQFLKEAPKDYQTHIKLVLAKNAQANQNEETDFIQELKDVYTKEGELTPEGGEHKINNGETENVPKEPPTDLGDNLDGLDNVNPDPDNSEIPGEANLDP